MQLFGAGSSSVRGITSHIARAFPTPALMAPMPFGVDISDTSVKWLGLSAWKSGWKLAEYGTAEIPAGVVESGFIRRPEALTEALKEIRKQSGILSHAHAALPEEAGYVFSMKVPADAGRSQIISMIEFQMEDRVPLTPTQAVYDYDAVTQPVAGEIEIAVVVFPKELAESYSSVFESAGIELLSLEIEARSIARTVASPHRDDEVLLLVDFGKARTGLAVVKNGFPIFTSTVGIGGDMVTKALMDHMQITPEECERLKNEHGIFGPDPKVSEAVSGVAAALADEIGRLYNYWDTKRDERGARIAEISRIILAGGSSNLSGLPDYVAGRVQVEVERADMWGNVCVFDEYVPPIIRRESFGYATAIGLALRGAI